jgi:hypothetical protein
MTTPTIAVQYRGGTTTEHQAFTGLLRELTIDTTKKTVVVHDGTTPGGFPLQRELISGQTLKTLNSQSLLGEGNIVINIPVASTTVSGTVKVDGTSVIITEGVISVATLPTASTTVLGGVKVDGTSITIDAEGKISGASTYTLPKTTTTVLGGVIVDGTTIVADSAGKISVTSGSGPPSAFSTFSMVNGELIVEHSSSFTLSLVAGEFILGYT